MLFYREAVAYENRARADRIEDTGAGMGGGEKVASFIRRLRSG